MAASPNTSPSAPTTVLRTSTLESSQRGGSPGGAQTYPRRLHRPCRQVERVDVRPAANNALHDGLDDPLTDRFTLNIASDDNFRATHGAQLDGTSPGTNVRDSDHCPSRYCQRFGAQQPVSAGPPAASETFPRIVGSSAERPTRLIRSLTLGAVWILDTPRGARLPLLRVKAGAGHTLCGPLPLAS